MRTKKIFGPKSLREEHEASRNGNPPGSSQTQTRADTEQQDQTLNRKIKYEWLNLSIESFKVKMKNIFLPNKVTS